MLEETRTESGERSCAAQTSSDDPYIQRLEEGVSLPNDAIEGSAIQPPRSDSDRTKTYQVEDEARELTIVVDERGLVRTLVVGARPGAEPLSGMESSMYSLLESICRGQSLQEAAEHGVARTEAWIRGTATRPVRGVVQPENASPIFRRPLELLRRVHADWRDRTSRGVETSRRRPTFATLWSTLDDEARRDRTTRRIHEFAASRGIVSAALPLVDIRGRRVTIGTDRRAIEDAGSRPSEFLFELETELRKTLDPDIEVLSAPKRDRNRKRQKLRGYDPTGSDS